MAQMYSRRRLAEALVAKSGDKTFLKSVVEYMMATKRTNQLDLLVRDVDKAALEQGFVRAEVTTATTLTNELQKAIETMIKNHTGATDILLEKTINEEVLGGVMIALPSEELDATTKHQLKQLTKAHA